jgi:hypothetical protein
MDWGIFVLWGEAESLCRLDGRFGGGSNARKGGNSRGHELMTFMLYENEIHVHGPWPGRVSSVGGGIEGAAK